ncbi:MAG: hypothetical protein A3C47_03655 [Omnitrophica bacterium RIFCSPHIGHO2_02_FULL_51_18]|nr:MAG: hypothetical protein A3C47_03655 [Omnitrophica bacterium RIFCSPHIGHO2_02_FULL_51_18]
MTSKKFVRLRASLAQINTTVGDIPANAGKVRASLRKARNHKSNLVIFPELTLTGYPPEDLLFRENFVRENIKALKSVLPFTGSLIAVLGFVDRDSCGNLFNAAAVLADKKIIHIYHKAELPNYGVFDERRYFTQGTAPAVIDFGGVRLGVSICEDIWQKNSFVYHKEYRDAVSLLVNISASPYHAGKQKERISLLKRLAARIQAPVVYGNLTGGQDELVFDGRSLVLDRSGKILAEANPFEEQLLTVDIPVKPFSGKTARTSVPASYSSIKRVWPAASALKKRASKAGRLSLEEEVYKALVLGTGDYIRKNRFEKVLIGLSGGIDSALAARIAVDALGAQNVIGVTMPSPYTSGETLSDAKRLAGNLGIHCLEFGIEAVLKSYLEIMERVLHESVTGVTEENLQARIRGNLLMALSNKYGYLVLTTGNKSEMATGYCTLYGDMAGGFAVLKDVPKTLVFRLARTRNLSAPKDSIPASILKRAPTAELRLGQKDQDILPPYGLLDRFLECYVEKNMPINRIIKKGIAKSTAYKIKRMVDGNEYKRRQAPPGVKITPKAFGRDRRMPITNRFAG